MLRGLEIAAADRWAFAGVGFGFMTLAAALWLLLRRFPEQETIAGAARLATILAVIVTLGLMAAGGSH